MPGEHDYLIVCVKSKDMESTLADAQDLVRRVGTVLTLQNGINKEPRLEAWAGPGKVVGASTMEGATLVAPGKCINPFTGPATAYFGELDGRITPRVEELARAFTAARMSAKAVDNIKQVTWEKLVQIGLASSWSVSNLAGAISISSTASRCARAPSRTCRSGSNCCPSTAHSATSRRTSTRR